MRRVALLKFSLRGRNSHIAKGKYGEDLATLFLKKGGYKILGRNVIIKRHEVDIIAMDQNQLVFIEVKSRSENCMIDPLEVVNSKAQQRLKRAANLFIAKQKLSDLSVRFDIIAIYIAGNDAQVKHIRNAF
ncbi:MAG: YraN family protein [Nitrospinota bacterium]